MKLAKLLYATGVMLASPALACPDGQYDACIWNACVCLPNGGEVVRTVTRPFREVAAVPLGGALSGWLQASRSTSVGGSLPIPDDVRAALSGYVSDDMLANSRYVVNDFGGLNLGSLTVNYGDADAITLIDVIVFSPVSDRSDLSLWAHELRHVQQYRDWGVGEFAASYVRTADTVEATAYRFQHDFPAWAFANHRPIRRLAQAEMSSFGTPSSPVPVPIKSSIPGRMYRVEVTNNCDTRQNILLEWPVDSSGVKRRRAWTLPPGVSTLRINYEDFVVVETQLMVGLTGSRADLDEWIITHQQREREFEGSRYFLAPIHAVEGRTRTMQLEIHCGTT